ncbi:ABC transporter permease [Chitinophaga vietnamensis]|uniref:ABC transporter permease n=1 Tax=Chitinophaga vietnamensis TaxID=2593957 RepID=UPI0011773D21|nr:ABC transporter permease [Chitinophaga vietnamensis]
MFRNYLKTAWRNLLNNKAYSALNIFGLAIGMAVALLISLWAYNEFTYDRFLPGYENNYQVMMNYRSNEGGITTMNASSLALADAIRKNVPGIQYAIETDWMGSHGLMVGDKKMVLPGGGVQEDFLNMFRFPLLQGNPGQVLKEPYSIVLTASTARSLFGNEDPMNKIVRFENRHDLKVTGVLADLPTNSTFDFKYLVPFKYFEQNNDWMKKARSEWGNNSFQIFVALQPGVNSAVVSKKLCDILANRVHDIPMKAFLHPMSQWRLYSQFENGQSSGGYITYVRMFCIIGALVLLIACINFINLATARSEKRAREVGVRKAIGSSRSDLIIQFLMESLLLTVIAAVISILILQLVLPYFNTLIGTTIVIPYTKPAAWALVISFILLTGLLAGSRPAFHLSAFRPVKVLKGAVLPGRRASLPRKVMVVTQFAASVALIISTIIIYQQINYAKKRPTGYNPSRLMVTSLSDDLSRNYDAIRGELLQTGLVASVSRATSPVTGVWSHNVISTWPGKTDNSFISVTDVSVSDDYFKSMGMTMTAGRDFYPEWSSDTGTAILNETAVKKMGLKDPIGQKITWDRGLRATVVGVVKDAVVASPFSPVEPAIFVHGREGGVMMYRLVSQADIKSAIKKLTAIFNKYNPAYPYQYYFADVSYAQKFDLETLVGKLAAIFAALAIFISCLGLLGLAAYTAAQKTKEIAVRKVMGASVAQLWLLLSREFMLLVIVGGAIASPLAFYFLHNWLNHYNYRIEIGPGVFIIAIGGALLITVFTISYQAIRVALSNPVKSLRSE